MEKILGKFQLFWEGHKNLGNLPRSLDIYLVNVQTEKLNYNQDNYKGLYVA